MKGATRTPETYPAVEGVLLQLVAARPGISLRGLCAELWPELRWRPLHDNEDSATERRRADGKTAAEQVRLRMGALAALRCVRVTRRRDEVDDLAAEAYELLDRPSAHSFPQ